MEPLIRESLFFVDKTGLFGRFYLPQGVEKPPVVVMAHGFGAQMSFGLEPFAQKFTQRGLAVFVFDYRNFGDSGGEPRNLVNPFRHLADWKGAVEHVRKSNLVDTGRMALWGTSFAGGHVLVTAAQDPDIRCVVSQVPFVSGPASLMDHSPWFGLRATFAAVRDLVQSALGRGAHTVPMVAEPGVLSPMNKPGTLAGYLSVIPPDELDKWENQVPARAFLLAMAYRPAAVVSQINCPVLFVLAQKDELTPPRFVEKILHRMSNVKVERLDVDHFDPYNGECFETVSEMEADFLETYL